MTITPEFQNVVSIVSTCIYALMFAASLLRKNGKTWRVFQAFLFVSVLRDISIMWLVAQRGVPAQPDTAHLLYWSSRAALVVIVAILAVSIIKRRSPVE